MDEGDRPPAPRPQRPPRAPHATPGPGPDSASGPGASLGLVLLTGGKGERLGGPKHDRPHPAGGSWGGRLVDLFRSLHPRGPVCVLGHPLPDHPDLKPYPDPGEGPAVALRLWAAREDVPAAERWWIVPCDQVRWTVEELASWQARAVETDPEAACWVMAESEGRPQPLGGILGHGLRPALAAVHASTVRRLAEGVRPVRLPSELAVWQDVDTPEDWSAWGAAERWRPGRASPRQTRAGD